MPWKTHLISDLLCGDSFIHSLQKMFSVFAVLFLEWRKHLSWKCVKFWLVLALCGVGSFQFIVSVCRILTRIISTSASMCHQLWQVKVSYCTPSLMFLLSFKTSCEGNFRDESLQAISCTGTDINRNATVRKEQISSEWGHQMHRTVSCNSSDGKKHMLELVFWRLDVVVVDVRNMCSDVCRLWQLAVSGDHKVVSRLNGFDFHWQDWMSTCHCLGCWET